jgi:hypothetical protein
MAIKIAYKRSGVSLYLPSPRAKHKNFWHEMRPAHKMAWSLFAKNNIFVCGTIGLFVRQLTF